MSCLIECYGYCVLFFFKQKTAYEMRISDWSSDVCSSDLASTLSRLDNIEDWRSAAFRRSGRLPISPPRSGKCLASKRLGDILRLEPFRIPTSPRTLGSKRPPDPTYRSEEHTSELQSLMRISDDVFCLKKKNQKKNYQPRHR